MAAVTVAVVVKDRRHQMLRCLDGLISQDAGTFELLVVDNGSVDGTDRAVSDRLAGWPGPWRVERVAGTLGRARNAAVSLAGGQILAFTDSDCIPTPGWLRTLVGCFDDPGVGIAQGPTRPEVGVDLGRWPATQHIEGPSPWFECCNIAYRIDALRSTAGFDETVGFLGEDTAAGWGVKRAGWKVAYAPEALVHHDVTHPGVLWHLRRTQRYVNIPALVRRYPEMRRGPLWGRVFLRRRNAAVWALLVGAAVAARRRPWGVLLMAPYASTRLPPRGQRRRWGPWRDSLQGGAYDVGMVAGLVRGSVRHRCPVL